MANLWAPWRIQYVQSVDEPDGCFLCRAQESADDRGALVVARRKLVFAVLNKYPYTGGHLMVAPRRHTGDIGSLSDEEMMAVWHLAREAMDALTEASKPSGFNVGFNVGRSAGAGLVEHLHLHVVPRWDGDTSMMPVIGKVNVIPDGLFECWERLRAAWPGAPRGDDEA